MKKLIIIGANNFQLPLIKKAREMGVESHVFAWENGAVGKQYADFFYPVSIVEKETILDKAKEIIPDGIASVGSDLAMHTVNYIAEYFGLPGNSLECTALTTDKYLMRQRLALKKLPCPEFTDNPAALGASSDRIAFPVIVKPTDRSGSRGITVINSVDKLNAAVERAIDESFNKKVIIEQFVCGTEYSIEMISWKGEHHFIQITEKETSGAPYFVEKGQHQPALLTDNLKSEVITVVKKALDALEVTTGASHSEIIITDSGKIYITEVGARMGGDYIGSDLVELSTGFDFVKAVIDIALGDFYGVDIREKNYAGIYYIFPKPGKVVNVIDNSSCYNQIVRKEIYVNVGDVIPEIKESNDRSACFIYKCVDGRFIPDRDIISIFTA